MPAIRGVECKVYLNTGTYASPTWAEWKCTRDTTLSIEFEEVDASCRGGGGFRQSEISLTAIEVTGSAIKEKADTTFIAAETAAFAKTTVDVVVLDGPIDDDDSDGWRFEGKILNWTENQPFEDIVTVDFTIKPARSDNAPVTFTGTTP